MGKRRSLALPFRKAVEKVKKLSTSTLVPRKQFGTGKRRNSLALRLGAATKKLETAANKLEKLSNKIRGPPQTAIATRRAPVPCPQGLDPLVQKAYHNLAVSPLCRIPDELLLLIMSRLNTFDLAILRRTSRIFLRLFSDVRFRPLHAGYRPGPWPRAAHIAPVSQRDLRERLYADEYCAPCFAGRMRTRNSAAEHALLRVQILCSGCRAVHSSGLFSPWERAVKDTARRVCVAHEGHLRVCQHRVVSWADIQRWAGFLSAEAPSYKVRVCGAPSHISQCGKSRKSEGGDGVVVGLEAVGPGRILVSVEWVVHVSVPLRGGSPGKCDANDVRRIAEGLHADAGRFVVPSVRHDDPPHMAAFDPNYCSCVHYAGRGSLDWQMAPAAGIRKSCRKTRQSPPSVTRHLFPRPVNVLWGNPQEHMAQWDVGPAGRPRSFRVAFSRCCGEKGGMGAVVTHRQSFALSCESGRLPVASGTLSAAPPEWYRVMDPASYGLEGDPGSRHTLWCEEEGCANHVSRAVGVDRFRDMSSLRRALGH